MPQYSKLFNVGTYTGNGGMYRVGIPTLRVPGPSGFQDAGSLRFRQENSAYLSRTQGTPTNAQKMTFSFWLKKTSVAGTRNMIFTNDSGSGGAYGFFEIYSDDTFFCGDYGSGGYASTYKFRDNSKWYHIVVAFDTTQTAAVDRMIVYIDNKRDPGSYTGLTQNGNLNLATSGWTTQIGSFVRVGVYSGIYLSEFYRIDGQQLTPSSFAELNSDGIWVPKSYSGTYGNTGFYLPMNTSANYATDQSGNGNNFTPSVFNVTTSNATYDLVTDSPTDYGTDTGTGAQVRGNYCTWDPVTKGSTITLASGNLGYTVGGAAGLVCPGTIRVSSGKWFWEVTLTSGYGGIGVAQVPYTAGMSYIGQDTTSWGFYSTLGKAYNNTFTGAYGTYTTNDVIGVALDADAGSITFYKNGVSLGVAFTGMTGPYIPITSVNGAGSGMANFGQRTFAYAAPSGFKAICSANIDRPRDNALWFSGDTPDLIWIKNRSTTGTSTLTDTVRGLGLNLITSSTAAETSYPAVTEMNKFGMTVINDATTIVNGSTNSHVYWGWKANGSSTVTNTNGSVTSQVSANPAAGFSIVTYTGNLTAAGNANVGHGLGAVPAMVIVKTRSGATTNGIVWHSSLSSATYALLLNTTDAQINTNGAGWLGGAVADATSTTFGTNWINGKNISGHTYVAYCWTPIRGYSDFGKYTGNGAAEGPFVYTGFRPRWIMVKGSTFASNWNMFDASRNTFNVTGQIVRANLTDAEFDGNAVTGGSLDILSNGFKIRKADGDCNSSGQTFIYAAFADIPFNFSRAR